MTERPLVVILRGHHANVGELRPWELLLDRFDVEVMTTPDPDQSLDCLGVPAGWPRRDARSFKGDG